MTFHYFSGDPVMVGDRVRTGNGKDAVVELIIRPGTVESMVYHCPDGGILIKEDWDGVPSLTVETPPDGPLWEDLVFLGRRS